MNNPQDPIPQISPQALAQRMAEAGEGLQLVDVREHQEVAIAQIPGFTILPLSEYEYWSKDITARLNPEAETLVICHHGIRSQQMCQWLRSQGFTDVKNIRGGIHEYARIVDPSIPQY
ncbi:rhodanese-like domain-containing protein [Spirulina subsalsa]|uniref:rhodanese-like domain-containing protein n=1 Tax=Spirulina subsalsa TaxID=54311 RepID=UPI0002EBA55D|nr:rhodanese-like domain-containing protein [Spirulina subsalsa]